jgi:hypothetical protein
VVTTRHAALATLMLAIAVHRDAVASHSCREVSPIVGRERCARFGRDWATTRWGDMLELSAMYARVSVHEEDDTGTVTSETTSATFHDHLAPRRAVSAGGLSLLFGVRSQHLLLGLELSGLIAPYGLRSTTQVDGYAPKSSTYAEVGGVGIVAGVHTHAGPFDLQAALAGLHRTLIVPQSLPPGFSLCHGRSGSDCDVVLEQSELIVEPRLSASVWIDPRTSLGATIGVDLAGGGTFAITLSLHGAPFDGF